MSELTSSESISKCRESIKVFRDDIGKNLQGGNSCGKTSKIAQQYILRLIDKKDLEKLIGGKVN